MGSYPLSFEGLQNVWVPISLKLQKCSRTRQAPKEKRSTLTMEAPLSYVPFVDGQFSRPCWGRGPFPRSFEIIRELELHNYLKNRGTYPSSFISVAEYVGLYPWSYLELQECRQICRCLSLELQQHCKISWSRSVKLQSVVKYVGPHPWSFKSEVKIRWSPSLEL
jgi:hypothetical protein